MTHSAHTPAAETASRTVPFGSDDAAWDLPGTLIGVSVGPGDPELLTLKAVRAIEQADVVVYHSKKGRPSAAAIPAKDLLEAGRQRGQHHVHLEYPVTTGSTDHPGGYAGALAEFYVDAERTIEQFLAEGKTVAVLALGDALLYSSYQHIHRMFEARCNCEVIPGISSIAGATAVVAKPLTEDDETLVVVSGTLEEAELRRRLTDADCAVVMKLGRTFNKVRCALEHAGMLDRAVLVTRVGMDGQSAQPVRDVDASTVPYFSVVIVPSVLAQQDKIRASVPKRDVIDSAAETTGEVVVVGLGPGAQRWTTPEVQHELEQATDLVGYSTYINRVPQRPGQRRHLSDNKVEAERAAFALDMAKRGRRVAVVSSGDPGVFAMAAAVLETADDDLWREVPVRIIPGMTAAQAVASRAGAPLGHDFGMISLSNRLKPWEQIEKRIRALAGADMAFAVYNPASKERREHIGRLKEIVSEYQGPNTPVIVARAVGSEQEKVTITTLKAFDPTVVDMRTMVIIGASTTRAYDGPQGPRVYTSRTYGLS